MCRSWLQENLTVEYNVVVSAMREAQNLSKELQREKEAALEGVQEARQRQKELQDFLEKEGSKLLITLTEVQKERDTASQAALEATSSATKAAEVLAQIMDSYNLEMAKARVMSIELQVENVTNTSFARGKNMPFRRFVVGGLFSSICAPSCIPWLYPIY